MRVQCCKVRCITKFFLSVQSSFFVPINIQAMCCSFLVKNLYDGHTIIPDVLLLVRSNIKIPFAMKHNSWMPGAGVILSAICSAHFCLINMVSMESSNT